MVIYYTKYRCATCNRKVKVQGINSVWNCVLCSSVICPKCSPLVFCPEFAEHLTDEEVKILKKSIRKGREGTFSKILML